jgi:uncharacterized protein involved in exopolysaccharide biosynthesis/Mrp family chromosome partitioning ATPase
MNNRDFDKNLESAGPKFRDYHPIAPINVSGLFLGLWRGKWIIVLTTICAMICAGYYAFSYATPTYAATATIKLELPTRLSDDQTAFEVSPTRLNTEAAILRSRRILEQVIVTLDLENDPEFNRYLSSVSRWSVTGMRDRMRTLITAQTAPSISPQNLRNKTIENLSTMLHTGPERGTYILTVTATTRSPATSQTIANAIANAYLDDQTRARAATTESTVARLAQRVSQLQQDLQSKETAINALLSTGQMTDETLFDRLSHQVNEANQRLIEARQTQIQNPDKAVQIDAVEAFHDRLTTQLAAQSDGLIRLQQLRREAQSTRVLYTSLLAQLQQTQIAHDGAPPAARILSVATPGRYVAPHKTYILAIAALLGAATGMAYVLVQRQRHVQSTAMSGHSDWPIITYMPRRTARKKMRAPDPTENAANQLRTSVLSLGSSTSAQVMVFTSCSNQDAHTQVALILAQSLARLERSVLFIYADAPHVPVNATHISEIITTGQPISVPDDPDGITRVQVASQAEYHADLFSSAEFVNFLDNARTQFDHILIDAAPVCRFPDARILAPLSDTVIVALRDGKTRIRDWETTQTALRQINLVPLPVLVVKS